MPLLHYNTTAPTAIDGKTVEQQGTVTGASFVAGYLNTGVDAHPNIQLSSLGVSNSNGLRPLTIAPFTFNGTSWDRETKANLTARLLSAAASTNATSVKASAGNVHKVFGVNVNAAARYLKFYNKASAPTVGTDTPVLTFYLPPTAVNGGVFSFDLDQQYFSTGIAYAMTTAAADADTGALTAGDVIAFNLTYS